MMDSLVMLRHGDMIFVKEEPSMAQQEEEADDWVFEDEIDVTLSNDNGLTKRKRDPQL